MKTNEKKLTVHRQTCDLKLQLFHLAFHPPSAYSVSLVTITGFIIHQSATCNIAFFR